MEEHVRESGAGADRPQLKDFLQKYNLKLLYCVSSLEEYKKRELEGDTVLYREIAWPENALQPLDRLAVGTIAHPSSSSACAADRNTEARDLDERG